MDNSYLANANSMLFVFMCLCVMCQITFQYSENHTERVRICEDNPPVWVIPPPDWDEWILVYTEARVFDSRVWDGAQWQDVFIVTRKWSYRRNDGREYGVDYEVTP